LVAAISACGGDESPYYYWTSDAQPDTGATDVGSDAPTDTDVNSDTDAGADGQSDTEPEPDTTTPDTPTPPIDSDGDGVVDGLDPEPGEAARCGDSDGDSCDDCTVHREVRPDDDGLDTNADGVCEVPLDPTCLFGEFANTDPLRREACELHALVNADRMFWTEESGGAAPLLWDEGIWQAAVAHSQDMCERDFFDHDNPEGLGAGARMEAVGVRWSGWGENISLYGTPLTIEYSFMAEPTCTGHRANILAPGFDRAASALYLCDNRRSAWFGEPFTTQNFVADGGLRDSRYCSDPRTNCEPVPNPVSIARQWCSDEGSECRSVEGPELWDCPDD
jgi:hypothetical protein